MLLVSFKCFDLTKMLQVGQKLVLFYKPNLIAGINVAKS